MDVKFVNEDADELVKLSGELDGFYFELYGDAYLKYKPLNSLKGLAGAAVIYEAGEPLGCCCWRAFDAVTAEIKRLYVRPEYRRKGAAKRLMEAIELHAAKSGCHRAVLDTSKDTPEAMAFYPSVGYKVLESGYGAYIGDKDCVCFEKEISDGTMR